jgi:hypothetical protein
MPRNVRNFWIEADIDGRKSPFAAGPVSKDGGFSLRISMRDKGRIVEPLNLYGIATEDGGLELRIVTGDGMNFERFSADRVLSFAATR